MTVLLQPKLRFKQNDGSDFPDWNFSKLASLSDVRDGTHESPKYIKDGFPLITSKNLLKDGNLDFKNINFITQEDFNSINLRSKVDIGDIIFGMIGTIGNPVLLKEDGFAIKNVALIKEKKQLSNKFLIYYLQSNPISKQFYILNTGGTQKFISLSVIRGLLINFPSSKEQQKIASFLSLVDKKIELLTKKHELLEKYKKGLMQKIFSQQIRFKQDDGSDFPDWESYKVGDLVKNIGGAPLEKYVKKQSSYKFISIGNYLQGGKYYDNGARIELNDITKKKLLNQNDLVMVLNDKTASGNIIGSTLLIDESDKYIYNQRSERIICNNLIDVKYIHLFFNSPFFRNNIFKLSQGGTQIYINFSNIKKIDLEIPVKEEQQKIASFLSSIDKKIDLAKLQIEKTQTFKKGLLQQMFV